jgi:site-specific recombinase XerC
VSVGDVFWADSESCGYTQFFFLGGALMYVEHFLAYMRFNRKASPETLKAYEHDLHLYMEFLAERNIRLTKVRPKHFSDYLVFLQSLPGKKAGQQADRATIARRIAVASSFHQWLALYTDGKTASPILKLHRVKRKKGRPNPIPERSSEALENHVTNPRDRAILMTFLASGLRLSELHQLNADSIRLEGYISLGEEMVVGIGDVIGKGARERPFLVDVPTYDLVSEYLDSRKATGDAPLFVSNPGTRLSKRPIQYVLLRWCERLALPVHHIHQLRHTELTRLAELGMPLLLLRDLAGHKSGCILLRPGNRQQERAFLQ